MYILIDLYICTYIHTYKYTYIYTYYVYIYMYTYLYVYIHTFIYIYICICIHKYTYLYIYIYMYISIYIYMPMHSTHTQSGQILPTFYHACGVAMISRRLKIRGFFCKRTLEKRLYSEKENCNFKEPANRSHHIVHSLNLKLLNLLTYHTYIHIYEYIYMCICMYVYT